MSLSGIAKSTLKIIEQGFYIAPSGKKVAVAREILAAVQGTRMFRPGDFDALWWEGGEKLPEISVTTESTAEAGQRLWKEGFKDIAALNFASARNPGGGFLGGAKAQEEDLARCSALYTCQLECLEYYEANRYGSSLLYSDHLIWSPDVPFFRNDRLELVEEPYLLSMITSPSPQCGAGASA